MGEMNAKTMLLTAVMLAIVVPDPAFAEYHVHYTNPSYAKYMGGTAKEWPCGNMTRAQIVTMMTGRGLVEGRSYVIEGSGPGGSSSPELSPEQQAMQGLVKGLLGAAFPPKPDTSAADAAAEQRALEMKQAAEQKARDDLTARLLSAANQRNLWDGEDAKRASSLSGMLDVPNLGTAFFDSPKQSSATVRDYLNDVPTGKPIEKLPPIPEPDVLATVSMDEISPNDSPVVVEYKNLMKGTMSLLTQQMLVLGKAETKVREAEQKYTAVKAEIAAKPVDKTKPADEGNDLEAEALKALQEAEAEAEAAKQNVDKTGKDLNGIKSKLVSLQQNATAGSAPHGPQ